MNLTAPTRAELFALGLSHIQRFCHAQREHVRAPLVLQCFGVPDFGVCAYYRDNEIHIWVNSCANIGRAGRAWSYPGYVVDRTPYGVLAHELGHHVDRAHGAAGGLRSHAWRQETKAEAITGYAPNDNEWFAELFRLFVTNPDLLRLLRPTVYERMVATWVPIETRAWDEVLQETRQRKAAENKIRQGAKAEASRVRKRGFLPETPQ